MDDRSGFVPSAVLELLRAAVDGSLLTSIEDLSGRLEGLGWTRGDHGGSWSRDDRAGWGAVSADRAPNASLFLDGALDGVGDGDERFVRVAATAVARAIDAGRVGIVPRWAPDGDPDDWTRWGLDDERWDVVGPPGPDWLRWRSERAVLSIVAMPAIQPGRVRAAAHVHLGIERADGWPEALPVDDAWSRRIAREGSVVARWHLANDDDAPDDVAAMLLDDPDASVRRAAEVAAPFRARRQAFDRGER